MEGQETYFYNNADANMATDMEMSNSPGQVSGNNMNVGGPSTMGPLPPPWMIGKSGGNAPPDPSSAITNSSPDAMAAQMMMMMTHGYGPPHPFSFFPSGSENPAAAEAGFPIPDGGFPLSGGGGTPLAKSILNLKNAVLYPPNPNAPPAPVRERPLGCRTIFIGGVPEKCKEETMVEIFERCGEIQSVRMSKKNFAHIRYINKDSVESALYFSGFRLKVEDKSEKEYSGKIHVDYAMARDDQYEFECAQRAQLREHRHRNRSPASPDPIPLLHYSDHEASLLLEKLKASETFPLAGKTVLGWLDRGDCTKRSATSFYSMIAAVNAHIRRLLTEKKEKDQELAVAKENHKEKVQVIMTHFGLIENVFAAARKQKNWDHFTKPQRKSVDNWLKQAQDIRKEQEQDLLSSRQEENMDTSDDENEEGMTASKKLKFDPVPFYQQQIQSLREELEEVKSRQIPQTLTQKERAVKRKNESLMSKITEKDQRIQELETSTAMVNEKSSQIEENETRIEELEGQLKEVKDTRDSLLVQLSDLEKELENKRQGTPSRFTLPTATTPDMHMTLDQKDAKLIALISSFLHVHPHGASVDYIWSYLEQKFMPGIRAAEIEPVLERFPALFKCALLTTTS